MEYIRKLKKLPAMVAIGGTRLPCLKLLDHLFHQEKAEQYKYDLLSRADPAEYPRLAEKLYRLYTMETLHLDCPRSFNEKIQWIKLYDADPLKTRLADKYLVREWVEDKIGQEYLIPLLGVWGKFEDIDFDSLPNTFILKCNHGSGFVLPVEDKEKLDISAAKALFDKWMGINFAFNSLELQYRDIPRKIIAEEYISQDSNLMDYKIHVFRGTPRIIQVIGDRNLEKHTAKECFLTPKWTPGELMYHTYDSYEEIPSRPSNVEKMMEIAATLGKDFQYVRVDLYNLDGQILFGEMTFTPASGYGRWTGSEKYLVGSWICLD